MILDFFEFLLDLVFGILELLGFILSIADGIAWIKSKTSRHDRQEARQNDLPLPPRTPSHVAFILLTIAILILMALLVWKYVIKKLVWIVN